MWRNCHGCLRRGDAMSDVHHPGLPGRVFDLPSRRTLLRVLASVGLMAPMTTLGEPAMAKKHRRRRRKKITRNAFGCVNVDGGCRNSEQCCSGTCLGKQGRKRCKPHNASSCEGTDGCSGVFTGCITDVGVDGTCNVTTGQASYCVTSAVCADCTKDGDCEPRCGPGAACLVCAECLPLGRQTACASATAEGCAPF